MKRKIVYILNHLASFYLRNYSLSTLKFRLVDINRVIGLPFQFTCNPDWRNNDRIDVSQWNIPLIFDPKLDANDLDVYDGIVYVYV